MLLWLSSCKLTEERAAKRGPELLVGSNWLNYWQLIEIPARFQLGLILSLLTFCRLFHVVKGSWRALPEFFFKVNCKKFSDFWAFWKLHGWIWQLTGLNSSLNKSESKFNGWIVTLWEWEQVELQSTELYVISFIDIVEEIQNGIVFATIFQTVFCIRFWTAASDKSNGWTLRIMGLRPIWLNRTWIEVLESLVLGIANRLFGATDVSCWRRQLIPAERRYWSVLCPQYSSDYCGFFFFFIYLIIFFKCDSTSLLSECLDWVVFSCDQVTRMIKSTVGWGSTIHFPLIKISWEFRDQKCGYKSSIGAERTSGVFVNAIEPEKRCWISLGLAEQIDGLLMLMFRKDTFGRYTRRCTTRRFYSNDNCFFF